MPSPIDCRDATHADLLAIVALDREAWGAESHRIVDGEHTWRVWVDHAWVYCATEGKALRGVLLAFPTAEGAYWVHKIFVDAPCRGRGIGTHLFRRLLDALDARGARACMTVDPANAPAIRLYEKWGFTHRRFVAGYYRKNEDRFVLTREPEIGRLSRPGHATSE